MSHSCAYYGTNNYLMRLSSVDIDTNLTGYWQCDLQMYWALTYFWRNNIQRLLLTKHKIKVIETVCIKTFEDHYLADSLESYWASSGIDREKSWPWWTKNNKVEFVYLLFTMVSPKYESHLETHKVSNTIQSHCWCCLHTKLN